MLSSHHYLLPLIKNVQYDTIYHEHLRYYSVQSLKYLFEKHKLEIMLDTNNDVRSMNCSCIEYQKTHLKKGPCVHIIALLKEIYRQESNYSGEVDESR